MNSSARLARERRMNDAVEVNAAPTDTKLRDGWRSPRRRARSSLRTILQFSNTVEHVIIPVLELHGLPAARARRERRISAEARSVAWQRFAERRDP